MELNLKTDENGKTVQVVESTQLQEVPYSSDEIKRQIAQHAEITNRLQSELEAVQAFEANSKVEEVVPVSFPEEPLVDPEKLEAITRIEEVEEVADTPVEA